MLHFPILFQEKDKLNQEHLQLQKKYSILQERMKAVGEVSNKLVLLRWNTWKLTLLSMIYFLDCMQQ